MKKADGVTNFQVRSLSNQKNQYVVSRKSLTLTFLGVFVKKSITMLQSNNIEK